MPRRPWTEGEVKRANDTRAAGYSYPTIDKTLRRPSGAAQRRLEIAGHELKDHVRSFRVPHRVRPTGRLGLLPPASNARLQEISVATYRPDTRRYTAKTGLR